jgi:hypothetical protein
VEAKNTSAAKKIEIEFLYLELDGCTRCRGTDANLETAIRTVQSVLEASGNIINVRKALVGSEAMVRSVEFVSSPTIRVNGRDIALELRETPCDSCTEACGCNGSVNCRVWLHGGKEYNEAPVPLIVNALLTEIYGTQNRAHPVAPEKFVVPDNLKRFFAAKEKQATSCCSDEGRATCCTPTEKGACCDSVEQESAATCGCK